MKPAPGPRPFPIKLFAAAFLFAALAAFAHGMSDLELARLEYADTLPGFFWNRDWTIVALSAELSIVLIPLTWIVVFASSFARWMILGFGLLRLVGERAVFANLLASGTIEPFLLIEPGLVIFALVMLFLPASSRWLSGEGRIDPATFN